MSDSRRLKRHRGKLSRAEPGFLLASLSSSLCGSPCLQSTPNPVKSLSSLSPHGCAGWGSGAQSGGASSWYWTPVEVKATGLVTGPRSPEEEEREGRKSRAEGCFPASCSEQEHEREEAWRGRRPCSLPLSDRPSLFLFSGPLSPSAEIQPSAPGAVPDPHPHLSPGPQLSSASSPFMTPLFRMFIGPFCSFLWFTFIASIRVALPAWILQEHWVDPDGMEF